MVVLVNLICSFFVYSESQRLDLQILGSMQLANKNLDSSEKFTLGGIGGVRAYPSGEASGDEGRKISFDLKYKPWFV